MKWEELSRDAYEHQSERRVGFFSFLMVFIVNQLKPHPHVVMETAEKFQK